MGKHDFSFSGPKTAVLRLAQKEIGENYDFPSIKLAERLSVAQKADIAASFQRVAVETIVDKAYLAYKESPTQNCRNRWRSVRKSRNASATNRSNSLALGVSGY